VEYIGMRSLDPRSYLICSALLDKPRHGYAILKQIEVLFPPNSRPAVATLYAALERLTEDGLVEVFSEEIVDGRARRSFTLTADGLAALGEEAARMAESAAVVQRELARRSAALPKVIGKPAARKTPARKTHGMYA
jgi:PadR family transcriptional regulator, regulatory protein PadR